jgi:hypothetical protein
MVREWKTKRIPGIIERGGVIKQKYQRQNVRSSWWKVWN